MQAPLAAVVAARILLALTLVFLEVLAAVVRKMVREQREPVVKGSPDQTVYLQIHILEAEAAVQAQPLVHRLVALLAMAALEQHHLLLDLQ